MADHWEHEIDNHLMGGALNLPQITLACALGLEARNPGISWRRGRRKLSAWFDRLATRPSIAATAPRVSH
jgi:glutathione S-transferase